MKTIDFRKGKIIYDEFHIDFGIPFVEQIDSLSEDLVQVEYENDYLIDLGWYPEYDENGKFILQVIKESNWKTPILKKQCKDWKKLKEALISAINIIEKE